jgi:hypothetical protein
MVRSEKLVFALLMGPLLVSTRSFVSRTKCGDRFIAAGTPLFPTTLLSVTEEIFRDHLEPA